MMLARFAFITRPYSDGLGLFVTRSRMPMRSRRMNSPRTGGRPIPWGANRAPARAEGPKGSVVWVILTNCCQRGGLRARGRWSRRMRIASGGLGRHVKPEGLGSDPVLQWRIEHNHLSIHGDLQAPAPGLDRGLLNRQEVQFINLLSAPDQKLSCQAKQPGPPLGIQHVQRQRSFGKRLARSRVNSDHAVLVV